MRQIIRNLVLHYVLFSIPCDDYLKIILKNFFHSIGEIHCKEFFIILIFLVKNMYCF